MSEAAIAKEPVTNRLEKISYQLLDMLDRQSQERQLLVREKEELGKLTQLLITQTKEIGQYENGIRKRIQDSIKESSQAAMDTIKQSIVEKSSQLIEQTITKIGQKIDEHRDEKNKFTWQIFTAAVLSSILSSFLLTWILIPKPTLPLTAEQMSYLQEGQMLVQMWPKLTKKEKDRLKAVSYEVLHSQ